MSILKRLAFRALGLDTPRAPDIYMLDDGSIIVEWIYRDFRFGLYIGKHEDSGWWFVSRVGIAADGKILWPNGQADERS